MHLDVYLIVYLVNNHKQALGLGVQYKYFYIIYFLSFFNPNSFVKLIKRAFSRSLIQSFVFIWNCLSPALGFPYKVLFSPSCSLLFSFLSFAFDQVHFPSCLVGRQAWLPGSGLPFKCCFYCSTVTDHWPETGVAKEASTPCGTHTFLNGAHWKGDFLLVWNSGTVWHMKHLLLWMQQNWAYKTRIQCCEVWWGNSHV